MLADVYTRSFRIIHAPVVFKRFVVQWPDPNLPIQSMLVRKVLRNMDDLKNNRDRCVQ